MTPTFCEECDNVHPESRKWHPSQWLCTKFPQLEGQGFVARNAWSDGHPFNRCVNINKGFCPLWTAKRNGASSHPDAKTPPDGPQLDRLERI